MNFGGVFVICVVAATFRTCSAVCYFPDYLQGEFSMQLPNSQPGQITYTPVSITAEAVSVYGFCNKKIGNGLYLIDSFNGTYCVRCFHISAKSQNIVMIRLAGHNDRCFVSSQAAESSCPKLDQLDASRQVILYKTKEEIRKEYCPINGRYAIHYKQNKPDFAIECGTRTSQLDNCPVGSEMNIRFRDCHFENHDLVFECLGSWDGPNHQKYLALFDTRIGTDPRPQYRCGLYREEPGSGTVHVAFSSDSTCITDLHDSHNGYETLQLTKLTANFPPLVYDKTCRFPSWTEGRWELVTVQGNVFTYTDHTFFKNYTFQCLEEVDQRYSHYQPSADDKHILVHAKTQCDEEAYTCIWLKKRGENVFEFQLATQTSQYPNSTLCSPQNFQTSVWITQGRKDLSTVSPCPILGEYVGMLPNTENLCAKLSSDCVSQDTMYYMVSDCSQQQIYEGAYSGPKYRKIRQTKTDDELAGQIPANETATSPPDVKNDTTLNTTSTPTPVPQDTTTMPTKTNDSIINATSTSAVSETTTVSTTTADGRSESSQRVVNDNYQASSEISVGSYYAENRNFGDFSRDIRLLPAPISSSTVSPYVPYRQNYVPPPVTPNHNPYYDQPRYNGYTTYRDDRRYRNDYYQQYNRNYPAWNQSYVQTPQSSQMYIMDPMSAYRPPERKTVIALPPVQLPPVPPTSRAAYASSRRHNYVHMFKEREYRCLGQWQENDLTYTFTQRKDIGTYECFVGTVISDYEISVREAGKHCERNMNSLMLEMKLSRKSSCPENRTSTTLTYNTPTTQTTPVIVTTTKYTVNKRIQQHTTRPWRPLNNMTRPQSPFRNKNGNTNGCTNIVPSHLFLFSILHVIIYKFLYCSFTS